MTEQNESDNQWDWSDLSVDEESEHYTSHEENRKNQKAKATHKIAFAIVLVFGIHILFQTFFRDEIVIHSGFLSIVAMILGFYFGDKLH